MIGCSRRSLFPLSRVALVFGFFLMVHAVCNAQTAEEAAKIVAALPARSQTVIARLSSLGELPDGVWKMHSGDLAHGEEVELDEADWKAVAVKDKAPEEAVWFRRTITVPVTLNGYDLTGAQIWFQFHAFWHGSMPEILYFNGRRVAMGDDLEPIVLLEDAKPGDKVVVAVKLLHTLDTKRFDGATMRIDFPSTRPSPSALRTEFLSAALLVPSLAPGDASKMTTLAEAIEAVDLKALEDKDQNKFDASLKAAQGKLEPLRPLLAQATLHLTGNSHIDAAWLWPWTETVDVVKRTFGTALQLMYEYPNYTYTQSAAAYNDWIAQKYPEMNDEIKGRIQQGSWEIVGGMWVEPDLNMPDGESLVRQLLVGKRWYKKAYGVDVRVGWNPDSFGYNWQLPQIYKKSGIDYFVTQKMVWNDTNQLPFKLFWWESPDGSKVLTYFPHGYDNDNLNPVRLSTDMADARKKATGLNEIMDLYGVGDHGGGPTRAVLDEGDSWVRAESTPAPVIPKMQFGTALPFFLSVEKQIAPESKEWDYASIAKGYTAPPAVAGKISIPTWKSEMYFEYHRGIYTTQANHKRNMRESEEQVLNAEKWASLAWVDGKAYPGDELTEDWKKVLFNQFHDLAAGSGIGVIYKDAQQDYDVVRMSTNEIKGGALEAVAGRIDMTKKQGNSIPIVIFNPLGWERSGDVTAKVRLPNAVAKLKLSDGSRTDRSLAYEVISLGSTPYDLSEIRFHVSSIPALGYKVFYLSPSKGVSDSTIQNASDTDHANLTLENENLRLVVRMLDGCITSIFDKRASQESLAPSSCGNQLQAFKDMPKDYDAWNIDPGTLDREPTLISEVDKEGTTQNSAIWISRHWQNSKIVQTIRIPVGADYVDIDNEIDWHEKHVLLKAAFPLAVQSDHATYEIPYGSIERTTKRTNSWEKAQFEVPALRWADLSGTSAAGGAVHGLSVINESKYGYDAVGNVLRLTLLRSPTWPDAEADQGHHHFRYALYPHAGTWQQANTVRHGYEYNYPLTAVVTTAHPGTLPASHSFASVTPENVVLTAVKKAEDSDALIFRVYEWAGKASTVEFHLPPGASGASVVNLMETPEGGALTVSGDVVKVPIKPFEILTLRVDYSKK
jgi:alpha-mannosidase